MYLSHPALKCAVATIKSSHEIKKTRDCSTKLLDSETTLSEYRQANVQTIEPVHYSL